jgi:hypothetical protein
MTPLEKSYRDRAADARADAEASALVNVRERCLRAAAAWEAMADRARRTEHMRAEQEARKAAEAAASVERAQPEMIAN